jgi:hypothetical protein
MFLRKKLDFEGQMGKIGILGRKTTKTVLKTAKINTSEKLYNFTMC